MQVTTAPAAESRIQLASSTQSLRGIAVGQKVEAVVMQTARAGELVTLQLADRQIQIRAEVPLTQGQTLMLERLPPSAPAALKLLTLTPAPVAAPAFSLQPGSQVAVEVIQLLARENLLVRLNSALPNLPAQLEVDISQLPAAQRDIRPGDKLLLEVVNFH